jgi:Leucine-rich repeat (LRR) protein
MKHPCGENSTHKVMSKRMFHLTIEKQKKNRKMKISFLNNNGQEMPDYSKTNCNSCGAVVKIESTAELIECPFCGSSFISENAKFTKIPDKELIKDLKKIYILGWTRYEEFSWHMFFKIKHRRWIKLIEVFRLMRWLRYHLYARKTFQIFYKFTIESQATINGLFFRNKKINESDLYLLAYFQKIRFIDFTGSNIMDHHLLYLYPLKSLQELKLDSTQITDKGLHYLKKLKNLETISLTQTNITEKGLIELVDLPHLRGIGFTFPYLQEKVNMIEIFRAGGAKMFSDAENLSLKGLGVTDADLKYLEQFSKISSLDLSNNQIHGTDLSKLVFCRNLTLLYLNNNPVNDECLEPIKELKRLEVLGLKNTHVSQNGVNSLRDFFSQKTDIYWSGIND